MVWTVLLLLWTVSGLGTSWLADRYGHNPGPWFWAGFLAGPLGFAATATFIRPAGVSKSLGRHL
jgi:hypothetical protein